jgi:TIR domain
MPLPETERKIAALVAKRFEEQRMPTLRPEILTTFKPNGPEALQSLLRLNVLSEIPTNQSLIPRPIGFHICGLVEVREKAKRTFDNLLPVLQHMYERMQDSTPRTTEVLLYDAERLWPEGYGNADLLWLGLFQCLEMGLIGGWRWERQSTEVQQLFINDGVMGIGDASLHWENYIEKESRRVYLQYRKNNAQRFLWGISDMEEGRAGAGVPPIEWVALADRLGFGEQERNWAVQDLLAEGLLTKKGASDMLITAPRERSEQQPINQADIHEGSNAMQSISNQADEILVFISHSSKDENLALALIELLRNSLGISQQEIRCSSVDGYRLEVGVNTESQLRQEVNAAKTLIALVTPNSLTSAFVMFELGARWGANLHLAPLLAGVPPSEVKQPLSLLNSLSASNNAQLHQFVENISKRLGRPIKSSASSYERYISHISDLSEQLYKRASVVGSTESPASEKKTSNSH